MSHGKGVWKNPRKILVSLDLLFSVCRLDRFIHSRPTFHLKRPLTSKEITLISQYRLYDQSPLKHSMYVNNNHIVNLMFTQIFPYVWLNYILIQTILTKSDNVYAVEVYLNK